MAEPRTGNPREVTDLLRASTGGSQEAVDRLFSILYHQLRRIAHRQLRQEAAGHTLTTTALVHEAYLKLVGPTRVQYRSQAHFFAVSARAMRRILIDYAVRRKAQKRGGGAVPIDLGSADALAVNRSDDLLALDDALVRLEQVDPRQSRLVECRFFGGMDIPSTATVLGVSPTTVKREWAMARAWLNQELGK